MNKLEDSLMVKLRESVVEEIKQVRDSFNHQIKELVFPVVTVLTALNPALLLSGIWFHTQSKTSV